ncbi:hypothetical protein GCM10027436_35580 [Actinophytocola sediminis]
MLTGSTLIRRPARGPASGRDWGHLSTGVPVVHMSIFDAGGHGRGVLADGWKFPGPPHEWLEMDGTRCGGGISRPFYNVFRTFLDSDASQAQSSPIGLNQ